jgi:hypothetical protein
MKKALVIPAHLITKFQQQTNYVNKKESKMDRIERQLDSILKNKKLNIYDKRDQYLMVMQELFDERDRLGEDLEIEINDPSQSTFSGSTTMQTPQAQNVSRASTFTMTPSRLTPTPNRTLSHLQSFSTPPMFPSLSHVSTPIGATPPPTGDPHKDLLAKQLTKYALGKGMGLYAKLSQHKLTGIIDWDMNGVVTIRGNTIPNSNIVALILRAVSARPTNVPPSDGFDDFVQYVIANIPKDLWGYNTRVYNNAVNRPSAVQTLPTIPRGIPSPPVAARTRKRKKTPQFGSGGLWIPF